MKFKLLATITVFSAIFAGAASATTVSDNSPDVQLEVNDGVATLFGSVDSSIEKTMFENVVKAMDSVDDVQNLIEVTN